MLTEFREYLENTDFHPTDFWGNWEKATAERRLYAQWQITYMDRCNERSSFSELAGCADMERAQALADMAAAYWMYRAETEKYHKYTR